MFMKIPFKMIKNLKRFYVLALIAMIAFSCEKDDSYNLETSIIQPQEKGYTLKKVTLNEVKQNSLIKSSLDNIEQQLDYNKTNTTKPYNGKNNINTNTSATANTDPIKSKDNTFTILTDEILQLSTDSTDVYTFRIEESTDPESDFENFIIHKWSDNTVEYYLYKYKINQENSETYYLSRKEVSSDQINLGDFDEYINSYYYYYDGCLVDITCDGGCVEVLWCDEEGGDGGTGGTGDGDSSTGGTSGNGGDTNNSNTDSESDPLYGSSSGGSGSSSSNANTDEGTVVGVLSPPPTPLEKATKDFFDNLTKIKKIV